jgi:AcrR family transcriptional regulator
VPRVALGRDQYLTEKEIAKEALRQFDEGARHPSIRQLAKALGVSPTAIYHHFPSQAAIVRVAVDLVFEEAERDFMKAVPDPFADDIGPIDLLVQSGVATRRAFDRHWRIAPFMAAIPEPSAWLARTLALFIVLLEGLGLEGEEAAAAFHAYSSFVFGAVIVAAERRIANEKLGSSGFGGQADFGGSDLLLSRQRKETLRALTQVIDLSITDPKRDEEMFADGLRRLMTSFTVQMTHSVSP